ncbi:DNA-processing protein DprA [Streptomyces huasconensis]|uniref:DNA-processing protein DprA n=1 Tax=Streptomyces huasconensis TaxID=1854574 RepID=UPI0033E63828
MTITGTRSTGHRELHCFAALFASYLGPFAEDEAHFYIGGAAGIDTMALMWLAGNSKSGITIVAPGTVDQQPADARQAINRCGNRITDIVELRADELKAPAYHERNRWMVDHSQMVIGFPLAGQEERSGTWQTVNYGAGQGKPRLIVPV